SVVRALAADAKTITHVMAVNPESANADRVLASVAADGSFSLALTVGRPYVLVFIDRTAVGAEMVVGMFRAGTLDTVSAQLAGHLEVGEVMVEPSVQTAAIGISYDDLLVGLGLSASAAAYLGSVDDLSLRYANPDIDGDGTIDMEQGRRYGLDFHVRANLRRNGHNVTVDDLTDQVFPDSGPDAAVPVFNLTSAYALYPASFDSTTYVAQTGMSTALTHGAVFLATQEDGSLPALATSFSGVNFGDTRGWGADYNYEARIGLELPGSGGSPATLAYTLGASGTTLTFTNVVTRTRASLTESGSLAIFVKLVTQDGHYTSIDYRWMKRASATSWVPATAEEIALTISSGGGYVSIHRAPAWNNEFGAEIPAQPSGSIAWTWQTTGPDDICGLAVSFDDKLGLRHFVGGADANAGVTCTF
ncbi:MAG: hypothetical protein H7138_06470, partial [Myxococcales bacterium]|nr:hypothetical protein [Myxococcales bacterium]